MFLIRQVYFAVLMCSAFLILDSFRRSCVLTYVMRATFLWYMQCILHAAKMYFYIFY